MVPVMPSLSARAEARRGNAARREDKVRLMGIIFNGMSSVALLFLLTESKIRQEARYLDSADSNERGNAISVTRLD